MLKIAEYNTKTGKKIDLKELEQFGMFYNPSSEVWLEDKDYQLLRIYENDREIEFETIQIGFNNYKLENKLNNKALSILYDLIEAGYVIKESE